LGEQRRVTQQRYLPELAASTDDGTWDQACRTSSTNDGPGVRLGCAADATGKSWDTWNGSKIGVAKLEPSWENPAHSASGSTWGLPAAGTGYY
jgi:hypothetical protein